MRRRTSNITGPCDPAWRYMLPPQERLPDLVPFVEERQYTVLHPLRQTGKTTAMVAFARSLRERGYAAVWATLERGFDVEEVVDVEPVWMDAITSFAPRDLSAVCQPEPFVG